MKSIYKILLRFWPIIVIVCLWFIFSSPLFLKNSVPFPSKYLVNAFGPWSAYEGFVSPVKNSAMPDVISQIYPWKTLTIDSYKNFSIPLWNPYSFSGMPLMANYQSAVFSPFNLLFFILPFIDAWSILVLLQPLLAAMFMYLSLRAFSISKSGSLLGSIAFMFCGFITTWMAYATLGYAIIFLPLSIFSIQKFYLSKKLRFLILLSLTIPLSFFSGHFQISSYFLLATGFFAVFKFFVTKNLKDFIWVFLFIITGILISLIQLMPSIELYQQSLRSGIFEKIEAIPWGYLPTFLAPDFFGNPVTRNDWFGHYAEWNSYIGVIPFILGVFAVIRKRAKDIIFFLSLGIIAVLFSFSTPFLDMLVSLKVPVLSTSAASRIIVLFSFSLSFLAAFGFDLFLNDVKKNNKKHITYLLLIFLIIFLSLWAVVFFKLFIPLENITIARQNLLLPTFLFSIFSVVYLFAVFIKHKKFNALLFITLIIIAATIGDLFRFANKWMPFDPKNLAYPSVPIVKEFNKINGNNRIFGPLGLEATNYYKLQSIEGYDALFIKKYGEFIASLEKGSIKDSSRSVVGLPKNGIYTPQAINLLGIKYIVNKKSDGQAEWNFPYWKYPVDTFRLIYEDNSYQILENTKFFERAFLVNRFVLQKNPQDILNTMFSKKFNLQKEIVLEEKVSVSLDASAVGQSKILNYTPNSIKINTNSSGNNMLFLSDAYYPGWNAYVDGKKTHIYRANFTFRAVFVPKGNHNIEFKYEPTSLMYGFLGLGVGAMILMVSISFSLRRLFGFPKL